MTLWSVIGNLGTGKTLFLVILGKALIRTIYSNFRLHLPNYKKLELIDFTDLETNVNVFIDEAYAWIDSRTSGSAVNRYCSYVILQSRKTFTDVFLTAQLFGTLDVRFRLQSNVIVYCQKYGQKKFNNLIVPEKFIYKIYNRETRLIQTFELEFEKAIPYFKLYDTLEIIDSNEKESLEYYLIKDNKKRLKNKVFEYVKALNFTDTKVKKLTHSSLKFALLINEIPLVYESYIYDFLKGKIIFER